MTPEQETATPPSAAGGTEVLSPGDGAPPIIGPGHTFASITDKISAITLSRRTPRGWWLGFAITFALVVVLHYAIAYLLIERIGIWGVNVPVAWASPSSISCGGSASAMRARSFPRSCCS
jgi:molybdopterin-containing oxidoreductase family membrane subunit